MGQKTDPRGFRLVVRKNWSSRWFARNKKLYAKTLMEDIMIRDYVMRHYGRKALIDSVFIERPSKKMKVTVYAARPGVLIGKKGGGIDELRSKLQDITSLPLHLNVEEVRKPELHAQIVANQIAQQLERRVSFRRVMKRGLQSAMRAGALGVKIRVSGRLNGADIARPEWYREGRVPLHTIRADLGYAISPAKTTYGILGVKVWICQNQSLKKNSKNNRRNDNHAKRKLRIKDSKVTTKE